MVNPTDYITGGIDTIILMILANTGNNTVKEISMKTGIKEEAIHHLLEFLVIAKIAEKKNDKYNVDEKIRNIARLLLNLELNDIN